MNEPVYLVDAFTETPFRGNPAVVCVLKQPRETEWMQRVAAEMKQAETAFVYRQPSETTWSLRWFTPQIEVDLCGHATLATAHVLWQILNCPEHGLAFSTRSGRLVARREGRVIILDFPADPPVASTDHGLLDTTLGVETVWTGRCSLGYIVMVSGEEQVYRLTPDLAALSMLDTDGCIVTARSDGPNSEIVSRVFAPRLGIPEDAVTGAAHCALAPFWAERLHQTEFRAYQASPRGGFIGVQLAGDRVRLRGQAVTVMEGILHV